MKHPMTIAGHKALQAELTRLKSGERPKIVQAIEEARAHGDLSENAEYNAAKEAQSLLEGRIQEVEGKLGTAQVVDVSRLSGEKVIFGATVEVLDCDNDEKRVYIIVGDDEARAEKGLISYQSPLARALIGKSVDDFVEVTLPVGKKEYEILSVKFIET